MNIGVNMLLWATCVTKEHRTALEAIRAAGADGVEIPIMEGEPAAYRELGRMLDDFGLKRTASMAFVTPDVNPVSDDPVCRQAASDKLRWLIACAQALGAPVICGPMYQTIGAFTGDGPTATEKARAANVLRGVAEEARGKIFGIFERFHTDYEGTGIGLAVVRRAAERMGGGVSFTSAPGAGSRFTLEIPLASS